MPAEQVDSGTQLAVISTEHTLSTQTDPGSYVFKVDASAMLTGDILQIRVKDRVIASGTTNGYLVQQIENAQSTDGVVWTSIPVVIVHEGKFTIKQTAGTGRSFPWSVVRL